MARENALLPKKIRQETCAGNGWNSWKFQEIYIFKKRPKNGLKAGKSQKQDHFYSNSF